MKCPHCNHDFGVSKGGLFLFSDQTTGEQIKEEKKEPPKHPPRGKAREYSKAFEIAWKLYPRREQKFEAFAVWNVRAREMGEDNLLTLIVAALNWQKKGWAKEEWYRPPYFERYLKRRKWEDEPSPTPQAVPRHIDDGASKSTDRKLAEFRALAERKLTPEQLAEIAQRRSVG